MLDLHEGILELFEEAQNQARERRESRSNRWRVRLLKKQARLKARAQRDRILQKKNGQSSRDFMRRVAAPKTFECPECGELLATEWSLQQHLGRGHGVLKHGRATLTPELVLRIRALKADGVSVARMSRELKVPRSTIYNVLNGSTWRHVA